MATAQGRLNEVGLYDPEATTYLFINVNLTSEAFDMIMALKKHLLDEYSGERRAGHHVGNRRNRNPRGNFRRHSGLN